jgi:hypothetical protein
MDDASGMADRMLAVLALPDRGESVAQAGRAHVLATYGAARLVHDIDRLYQRLLSRKGVA